MKRTFPALIALAIAAAKLQAMTPPYTTDDDLVERSDAIVEGHVEAGFETFDPSAKVITVPALGHGTEYRTVLVVTKSIKGHLPPGPTPLIIHNKLRPVVLEPKTPDEQMFVGELCPTANQSTGPQVPVGLFFSSTCIGMPPTADIRKDQIWFLRKASLSPHAIEDTSALGVRWQQDVQPLEREGYYRAILSGDPEALWPYVLGDSWEAQEASECQERLRVLQLAAIRDPGLRASALITFIASEKPFSSPVELAMGKLVAIGPVGLQKLVPLFLYADHSYYRFAILNAWSESHYQPAVPALIDWLRSESQWWSEKTPKDMIWSFQAGLGGADDPRAASYQNVFYAVMALGNQGGGEGRAIIEQTRTQWAALGVRPAPGNDIVAACDQVLGELK